MGIVVEARHLALEERVALKFLLPNVMANPEAPERFLREARAAAKIKSEHVARVSDVGTLESGAPYMVMEFLEGSDLSRLVHEKGPLPVPDAVDYLIQGCEAIAEAHSHGIVHRDLKPANLFLTRRRDGSPLVKVLDFGISKRMGPGVENLTKTSAAMGSALYMSPEQMQETRAVDHRTDIYALGVALFELLTGTLPFMAETLPQLCAAILTGTPRPLRQFRPDAPEQLAAVVARAYERDRALRYQSVGELVVALAPYAPPRSYMVIERVARMCGVEPPALARISSPPEVSGSSPPGALPSAGARASQGVPGVSAMASEVGDTRQGGPERISPVPATARTGTAPNPADYRRSSPPVTPERTSPVPAVTYSSTQPLPVINDETPAPETEEIPSKVVVSGYMAPFSVKASAAFASGAPLPAPGPAGAPKRSRGINPVVLAVFAVGLAALAAVVVAIVLRMKSLSDPSGSAPSPEPQPAVTAPAEPPAPRPDVAPEVVKPPEPPAGGTAAPTLTASAQAAPASSPAGAGRPSVSDTKAAPTKGMEAPKPSATGKTDHGILSNSR